jgi:hypothetical protein
MTVGLKSKTAITTGSEKGIDEGIATEPRWPVALAILALLLLLAALPGRVRLLPSWVPYAIGIGFLLPMAAVRLTGAKPGWVRIERATMLLLALFAEGTVLTTLAYLIREMLGRPGGLSGMQLLTTSIGGWVTNVIVFSLVYWRIDRGGPEARANDAGARPDWLFPQTGAPEEAPPDWRPTYVDYLFLGYSTATAFSPTDALPLTSRAKMLMMLESAVSLTTLVVVAARAINILGS